MIVQEYFDLASVISLFEDAGRLLQDLRLELAKNKESSEQQIKQHADLTLHQYLIDGLSRCCAGVPVISEEDTVHLQHRPDLYWLIDPIDGTASWYDGFSGYVTQAALINKQQAVFGIVRAPQLNKTWYAISGQGAYLNNSRLAQLTHHSRLLVVDNYPAARGFCRQLCDAINATGYVESGSIGLKGVLVADGSVDLFVKNVVVRDWDVAPIIPIIQEVGGCLCSLEGQPYVLYGDIVKTTGLIVARTKDMANQIIKAAKEISNSE